MDPFEANTHVFIVRIWLEPRDSTVVSPEWRGVIEHAPTQQRRYFRDLAVIPDFIEPYLDQMGIRVGLRWRLSQWLKKIVP